MTAGEVFGVGPGSTSREATIAFQPIVDLQAKAVWGYEARPIAALPRDSAADTRSPARLDEAGRLQAIESAATLYEGRPAKLTIGVGPDIAELGASLHAIQRVGLARDQVLFEFADPAPNGTAIGLTSLVEAVRACAGDALRPDLIRLGAPLVRDIHRDTARQRVVAEIVAIARGKNVGVLAGAVERIDEVFVLRAAGVFLMQGAHFAKPMAGGLPRLEFEPFDDRAHQRIAG